MEINKKPWPVMTVCGIKKRIDTNPDFQRPPVWSRSQKQLLIDTIVRGYDMPKLYWRKTGSSPDRYLPIVALAQQGMAADHVDVPPHPEVEVPAETHTDENVNSPTIRIEAILSGLDSSDEEVFRDYLVPWRVESREVVEATLEGEDPFHNASVAIRVVFEGWYDPEEDDFLYETFFLPAQGMDREDCPKFLRNHKRQIGFLIYRDFRALTRPITLNPATLFSRLLHSQDVIPKHFEAVLAGLQGVLDQMTGDADFASILNSYKAELERFLFLAGGSHSALSFEISDRTRSQVKEIAQLYEWIIDLIDEPALPRSFCDIIDLTSAYMSNAIELGAMSLLH
jgi:hypothetical protein